MQRSDRILICASAAAMHARDRPSHYGHRGAFFFRSAGDKPPQSPLHPANPANPANPGHPDSDAIDMKVLSDLFALLRLRSIDMKVFQTFALCDCGLILLILFILNILNILLQTHEASRKSKKVLTI